MNENAETRTLRDYLRVLANRRWLILAITGIAALAALTYSVLKEPEYTATAAVSFEDPAQQGGEVLGGNSTDFFKGAENAAGAKIVTRPDVVEAVAGQLKLQESPNELRSRVDTKVDSESNLVSIEATSDDPDEAAALANAFAEQVQIVTRNAARKFYGERAAALKGDPLNAPASTRLKTLQAVAEPVDIVRPAEVPKSPSTPKPVRDTILAALLGLMVGVGVAFLRESLDRRLSDAHQVQQQLGIPLVGYVRADSMGMAASANGRGVISEDDLEAFRILRTNVDFLAKDDSLRSVAVTSALPEEGKSTVAAWYAYACAVAGRRTLLVECDFRRPVLARRFEVEGSPGLSDYLAGNVGPKEVLRSIPVEGRQAVDTLPMIPAGGNMFQPAEMIGSQRFHDFFDQVTRAYDLVVVDSSPLLPVGDTLELLPHVDGILLCVRLGQTTRDQAIAAKKAIDHLPEKPTGLVVTGLRTGSEDDYYGYYSYSGKAEVSS